jgi:hypothetical protein
VLIPTGARYAGGRRSSWAKVNSLGDACVEPQLALDDSEIGGLWSLWFSCPTGVADVWIHVDEALRSPNRLPAKGGAATIDAPESREWQVVGVEQ